MKSIQSILIVCSLVFLCSLGLNKPVSFTISGTVKDATDGSPLPGVTVKIKGQEKGAVTDFNGAYQIEVPSEMAVLTYSFIGYQTLELEVGNKRKINVLLNPDQLKLEEVVVVEHSSRVKRAVTGAVYEMSTPLEVEQAGYPSLHNMPTPQATEHNTEEYATIHENTFSDALKNPLTTFSIDVDNAAYSNMRRYINMGQTPPKDAIRIEEMINYFTYDYPQPEGDAPFSVNTEVSICPWNTSHQLVHIGLQGKKISTDELPPSNLVFLVDVSGSMSSSNKLPLVKAAFRLLVNELRPQDRVSIVVYAGAAGEVLPSTPGNQKAEILGALELLAAGGSTAGGAGIQLAYKIAEEHFVKGGNNRVILATDGDFNVGVSSTAAMERLVEEKRASGVFLTVLGFGMGNLKDSKMETMADKGNGNYAYIDNIQEAKKVFVNEFGGTLFTIAKDVKLQLEFNPTKVKGYRLLGYENRALKNEDFNNDKKDAGDLGSGHTVTAIYEIIPAGVEQSPFLPQTDELKYQQSNKLKPAASTSDEILTLKLRYKQPDGNKSKLIEKSLMDHQTPLAETTDNFRFSAAVASFGMLLRDSEFKGDATYHSALQMAEGAKGADKEGYRAEFINLVRSMQLMAKK